MVLLCTNNAPRRIDDVLSGSPRPRHTAGKWISFSLKQFFLFSLVHNFVCDLWSAFLTKLFIGMKRSTPAIGFVSHLLCSEYNSMFTSCPPCHTLHLASQELYPERERARASRQWRCYTKQYIYYIIVSHGLQATRMDVVTPVCSVARKQSFMYIFCIIGGSGACDATSVDQPCCVERIWWARKPFKYMYGLHVKRGERVFASVASVYVRSRYIVNASP